MTFAAPLTVALLECRAGRVVRANRALAGLVGAADPARLVGRSPDDWLVDTGDGLPDWSAGELRAGAARAVECSLRSAQGARRVRVVSLGDGLWELHDVTELRRMGEEARTLAGRLREVRQALEAGRDRGARERAQVEEILTLVSHELRTPVTVLAGFLKLLLGEEVGPLTEPQRRFLEECQRSVRRLDAFVANLLMADGRAGEEGDEGGAPRDASLVETVQGVADFLKPLLEEGGHRLVLELAHDAVRARFDPSRVEQVLVNLIGNAIAHGRPAGEISVATRRLAAAGRAAIEVAVSDQGPGIPADDRERVFEPYARAGQGGTAGGLGLGLAISRRLVEAQGGTIVAGEAPGGGARVAFTLPAAEEAP